MANLSILQLNSRDDGFSDSLQALLERSHEQVEGVETVVADIISNVRSRGDQALLEYTNRFDRMDVTEAETLELSPERLQQAVECISDEQRQALDFSIARVRDFHQRQYGESWTYTDETGTLLGQQVTPLDRVGLYVPGGKAAYPSTVVMTAIPAQVAGVGETIMVVPTPDGEINELVLAAAALSGVDRVFTVGGAQAIAALAYGTETIPAVDKIVGPGNAYVATAKRRVFGKVGIDMVAGPSEIVVLCDGSAGADVDPEWIAMDLFSQAEHDELAQSILITTSASFAGDVLAAIEKLLPGMEREQIIREALQGQGAIIVVSDLDEAIDTSNRIAPEHLELIVDEPLLIAKRIRHAGAIFMGAHTNEVLGDYCAGPNHTLPTSGTARFSSPLGTYDFQKRSSLIQCSPDSASKLGKSAAILAHGEGLTAHARSAEARIKDDD
ncbi:MAG: histidinol dehydrogenase [Gammaproteobacteria bacterium]|nr:histidinol dehydrogenase [Gammaproteobacteria bacterium]